jgi:light-regulated signal transduction histidine kinase (bacteriophytochrome)
MKPILSQTEDKTTLQELGRASIQIVHDLKNQLNGLKLYATFLRKRMEKGDRPDDELETVGKLISGLDRAASDLSTIVEYGRRIELKSQPGLDLQKVMRSICTDFEGTTFSCDLEPQVTLIGEFDPTKLTDALKWISAGAVKYRSKDDPVAVTVTVRRRDEQASEAEIEWAGLAGIDHDPFQSFVGTVEIRMSLANKIVEAHGGTARYLDHRFVVALPLTDS